MKSSPDIPAISGRLLMGTAAGISLYLASMALSHSALPGCEEHSFCQEVLRSNWAFTFGIPVSFAGFVLYLLTILWSWAFARRERSLAGLAGGIAVSTSLAGAVWFTVLQVYEFRSLCVWCCGAHGSAVAGALLLSWSRMSKPALIPSLVCSPDLRSPRGPLSSDYLFRFTSTGAALTGVGLLVLGSLWGPRHPRSPESIPTSIAQAVTRDAGHTPVLPDGIALPGGKYHLNPDDYPVIGRAAAGGRTAVLLGDYTCSKCLKFHALLENLAASANPPVRFIILPGARTQEAEDIQRTVLTVFHADRAAWRSLSALLTSGQIPAEPLGVERAALRLVNADKFAASAYTNAEKIAGQLQLAGAVMHESRTSEGGTGMLPQLLCGERVLAGAEKNAAQVLAFLVNNSTDTRRPEPKPLMTVLNSDLDLAGLKAGKPQDIQIKVQNKGNAPLKLGWLVLDEGCEVTHMPDKKIHPGEVAAVGVRFTPPTGAGSFTRRLHIHSDPASTPGLVTLHGTLTAGVTAATAANTP